MSVANMVALLQLPCSVVIETSLLFVLCAESVVDSMFAILTLVIIWIFILIFIHNITLTIYTDVL